MKKLAAVVVALGLPTLILGTWVGAEEKTDAPKVLKAVVVLHHTTKGKARGVLYFVQKGDTVEISGTVTGLTPGAHGFHVHEFGDCSAPDATSAGGHFNPTKMPHGAPDAEKRHVGDLGNIKAGEDGNAVVKITDKVIRLEGPNSIIGRGLIVHHDADDFSQPVGHAGDRVACGVIGYAKQ